MGAISKILVAVDFSDHSRAALDYAAAIAGRVGAAIDLLHVWEIPLFEPPELTPEPVFQRSRLQTPPVQEATI